MKTYGITGGIGCGKSVAARIFNLLGIPSFNSDLVAKEIAQHDSQAKHEIISVFGEEAYENNLYNKPLIAKRVFSDKPLLEKLNEIIHPKVAQAFQNWKSEQSAPFVLKEAALLVENGSYRQLDGLILIDAPVKIRLERVLKRDPFRSENEIINIINSQMPQEEKKLAADFIIINDNHSLIIPQVQQVYHQIVKAF